MWDEYGRKIDFLSCFSSKANRWEVFHISIKIHEGASVKLGHDPIGKSVDQTLYRNTGNLLYLTTSRANNYLVWKFVRDFRLTLKSPT